MHKKGEHTKSRGVACSGLLKNHLQTQKRISRCGRLWAGYRGTFGREE